MLAESPAASAPDLIEYARILSILERYGQAREELNAALGKAGSGRMRSAIYYTLSTIAETPEERYAALQDAVFEDPQNISALVGYSEYFENQGDYVNARKWLSRAVVLLPDGEGQELRLRLAELEGLVDEQEP